MDSKAINKLIRSEIWPILRQFGFSHFEARNAFAYRGHFINVVNFQSFNSYHAGGLGCTTFSFAVNLGVYVVGQPGEDRVRCDKADRLLPDEAQCAFRFRLRKRAPVDGFARDEIFFIDAEGRTTGSCFEELRYLATQVLPRWFEQHNGLHELISKMNSASACLSGAELSTSGRPGSYSWNTLKSLLVLLDHETNPTEQSAAAALQSLDQMIGSILDFGTIQSGRPGEERHAVDVRELWDHLGEFRLNPDCMQSLPHRQSCLDGPVWAAPESVRNTTTPIATAGGAISARKDLWPILKSAGFSVFTDRLAHRISKDFVEVVEFLPMDDFERRTWTHPPGLFRIGLGLFWNDLREDGLFRKDCDGSPRPIVNECHISNWLAPRTRIESVARTAFDSIEDAKMAIFQDGLHWLDIFRDANSALSMFHRADWELFWCYPMMRGYGAKLSPRRLIYLAQLWRLLNRHEQSEHYGTEAEAAIDTWYVEHLRSRYRDWIANVGPRLRTEIDD